MGPPRRGRVVRRAPLAGGAGEWRAERTGGEQAPLVAAAAADAPPPTIAGRNRPNCRARSHRPQTAAGWLLVYDLHATKQPALPHLSGGAHWGGAGAAAALARVDVYVKHTARCQHAAPPTALACDARAILVAYADGFLGSCSWSGKVCGARPRRARARARAGPRSSRPSLR